MGTWEECELRLRGRGRERECGPRAGVRPASRSAAREPECGPRAGVRPASRRLQREPGLPRPAPRRCLLSAPGTRWAARHCAARHCAAGAPDWQHPALDWQHPAPDWQHPAPDWQHQHPCTPRLATPSTGPRPTGNTQHPTGNTQHPLTGNTQHPTGNTQHPTGNTQHLTGNTQHPTGNTQHPTGNTQHPTGNTQHPTGNTQHPLTGNTEQPLTGNCSSRNPDNCNPGNRDTQTGNSEYPQTGDCNPGNRHPQTGNSKQPQTGNCPSRNPETDKGPPQTGTSHPGKSHPQICKNYLQTSSNAGNRDSQPGNGHLQTGISNLEGRNPETGKGGPQTVNCNPGNGDQQPGNRDAQTDDSNPGSKDPDTGNGNPGSRVLQTGNTEPRAGNTDSWARNTDPPTGNTDPRAGNTDDRAGNTDDRAGNTDDRAGNTGDRAGNTDPQAGNTDPQAGNTDPRAGNTDLRAGNTDHPTGNNAPWVGNTDPPTGCTDPQTDNNDPQTGRADPQTGNSNPGIRAPWNGNNNAGNGAPRTGNNNLGNRDPQSGNRDLESGISNPGNRDLESGISNPGNRDLESGSSNPGNRDPQPGNRDLESGISNQGNRDVKSGISNPGNRDIKSGISNPGNRNLESGIGNPGNRDPQPGNRNLQSAISNAGNRDFQSGSSKPGNRDLQSGNRNLESGSSNPGTRDLESGISNPGNRVPQTCNRDAQTGNSNPGHGAVQPGSGSHGCEAGVAGVVSTGRHSLQPAAALLASPGLSGRAGAGQPPPPPPPPGMVQSVPGTLRGAQAAQGLGGTAVLPTTCPLPNSGNSNSNGNSNKSPGSNTNTAATAGQRTLTAISSPLVNQTPTPTVITTSSSSSSISLVHNLQIPPGMVLARSDSGQLVLVPQKAIAQAQARARAQAQASGTAFPTATSSMTSVRISTVQATGAQIIAKQVNPPMGQQVKSVTVQQVADATCSHQTAGAAHRITLVQAPSTGGGTPVAVVRAGIPARAVSTLPQKPTVTPPERPSTATATQSNTSLETLENVKKCKNFLATLIKLASGGNNSPEMASNVKGLVQKLLDGKMEAEEFTSQLYKELKSLPQPYLVPFLKRSLPALRIQTPSSQLFVQQCLQQPAAPDLVRKPGALSAAKPLGVVRTTLPITVTSPSQQPNHSPFQKMQQPKLTQTISPTPVVREMYNSVTKLLCLTQGDPTFRLLKAGCPYLRNGRANKYFGVSLPGKRNLTFYGLWRERVGGGTKSAKKLDRPDSPAVWSCGREATSECTAKDSPGDFTETSNPHHCARVLPNPTQQVQGVSTPSVLNVPAFSGARHSLQASPAQRNKMKEVGGSVAFRDEDDINDVASMAGVNICEENARILATNSETVGTMIHSCKDEAFLSVATLQKRVLEIGQTHGVMEVSSEVLNTISHATQERLSNLVKKLNTIAQHRMVSYKDDVQYSVSSDARTQLKFFEQLERLEKQRKDEVERETLLRLAKSRVRQEDPEQMRLKQKAKEMQQMELAQMQQREANLTALAAIGPRKRKLPNSPALAAGNEGASGGAIALGGLGSSVMGRLHARPRLTRVNLRDLLFCLDQEREMKHSLLLYRSYLK
ncbi:LOW QUALITY PROTEIN: mucin-5AC [Callorhinchus milii]|uniref:LOW QUALITY PROTEIN: mucin-5AC n=1 Tax=Callorhinchus milii TaxID=7868 RepID=UPI001C3F5794|nr:LOW QUALITY PROTEIN: mucin-5AC [Callorhinchus milii]